jgi:hypothetical protein
VARLVIPVQDWVSMKRRFADVSTLDAAKQCLTGSLLPTIDASRSSRPRPPSGIDRDRPIVRWTASRTRRGRTIRRAYDCG